MHDKQSYQTLSCDISNLIQPHHMNQMEPLCIRRPFTPPIASLFSLFFFSSPSSSHLILPPLSHSWTAIHRSNTKGWPTAPTLVHVPNMGTQANPLMVQGRCSSVSRRTLNYNSKCCKYPSFTWNSARASNRTTWKTKSEKVKLL